MNQAADAFMAIFGLKRIDEDIQEAAIERAAILEFDAGYPKEKAEALAMAEAETWQKERGRG